MKKIYKFFLFILCTCLIQCEKEGDGITVLYPLTQTTEIENLTPYISLCEFIQLEETDNSMLASINKIIIDRKGNFIINGAGVKIFNSEGKFLYSVGRKGRGPGEYSIKKDICLSNDCANILVLDMNNVLEYSSEDGKFIKNIAIPAKNYEEICPAKDGGFYLFASNPHDWSDLDINFNAMDLFNNKGEQISEFLPRKDFVFTYGFFSQSYDNNYYLRPQEGDNILYKVVDGDIQPVYRIDFGNKSIPPRYMKFIDGIPDIQDYIRSSYFKLPLYFQDSQNQLYFLSVGPGGHQHNFLYAMPGNRGIHWEDKNPDDSTPLKIRASDNEYLYAVLDSPHSYFELSEKQINPLTRYLIMEIKNRNLNINENPIIAKIKFTLDDK